MRYGQRLFTGIVGLLLVLLVVVTPGYIASKAHDLETGGKNVLTFSEVIAGAGSGELTYTPYCELNSSTALHYYYSTWGHHDGPFGQSVIEGFIDPITYNYNFNSFNDTFTFGYDDISNFHFYMNIDFGQMVVNDALTFYVWFDPVVDIEWRYESLKIGWTSPTTDNGDNENIGDYIPAVHCYPNSHIGGGYGFTFTLSEADVNTISTMLSGVSVSQQYFSMEIYCANQGTSIVQSDMQISPEYYEVEGTAISTTSGGNTTHYLPIDYKIGYYDIRSASLLVGGILIMITALCSTSLVNPSNILKGKKRLIS